MTLLFGVHELKRSNMYKKLDQCLCCGNTDLFTVLDLNTQPPANSFHKPEEQLPDYELKLMGCGRCWHTQLSVAVDPSELFKHYLYVSGTSKTLKEYFDWFASRHSGGLQNVLFIPYHKSVGNDNWNPYREI